METLLETLRLQKFHLEHDSFVNTRILEFLVCGEFAKGMLSSRGQICKVKISIEEDSVTDKMDTEYKSGVKDLISIQVKLPDLQSFRQFSSRLKANGAIPSKESMAKFWIS
ncbi:hypothetical protein CR513_40443, partial [Mucuna pruriens]